MAGQETGSADSYLLGRQLEESKVWGESLQVMQMKSFNLFKINCTTFSPKLLYW